MCSEIYCRLNASVERRGSIGRQQRLDRALASIRDLESQNAQLQTDFVQKFKESQDTTKVLREIASVLRITDVPANDQVSKPALKDMELLVCLYAFLSCYCIPPHPNVLDTTTSDAEEIAEH